MDGRRPNGITGFTMGADAHTFYLAGEHLLWPDSLANLQIVGF
ncbi:hypothetical protein [Streptomyces kaniharaensis]|nr:hypothetical protein [Streptomyces kaniharaensis]